MSVQLAGAGLRRHGLIGGQRAFAAIDRVLSQCLTDRMPGEVQVLRNASHRVAAVEPMNDLMTLFGGHVDFSFE